MEEHPSSAAPLPTKSGDEIALELMKYIATSTGFGKGNQAVGFSGKPSRAADEQVEALLELFARCRRAVREPV